ncbi:MAG: TerC family protein [Bacteroidota bacterium]|nr:TerC family protein [Bacteroidota bacterium]
MNNEHLINHPWLIVGFSITIIVMLLLDLGIFNKKSHVISNKEALFWSVLWISLAMLFSVIVYYTLDKPMGTYENFNKFQAAYWIEKALSVDNLFVFILVFKFFKIPKEFQHKILFWGILGALVFRAIFIFAGVELINHTYISAPFLGYQPSGEPRQLNLILFIFGIFLFVAGLKSWKSNDENEYQDLSNSFGVKLVNRFFKTTNEYDGDNFFIVRKGIKYATPLFVALVVIEITDLVFAVDSIPAIFGIAPDDPFILYTSNIFAILGLRSLYFLLANSMDIFSKLNYGLAIILGFIGIKMIIMPFYHFESIVSLSIIGGVLFVSVVWSLLSHQKNHSK